MSSDLMMRIKDQVLIVLADYQSCKLDEVDSEVFWERESLRVAIDITGRVIKNYMILSGRKKELPYITLAKAKIEALVQDAAKAKRDPWACCRDEGTRIRMAYDIARAIDEKAGAAHKFTVFSATVYSASKVLKGFKRGESHRGINLLIAAPSKKKGVEMVNDLLGGHETVSWANQHWTGGGTTGKKVATKIGIWAAEDGTFSADNYKLVWEPK